MLKLLIHSKITIQLIGQHDPKNEGRDGQCADNYIAKCADYETK